MLQQARSLGIVLSEKAGKLCYEAPAGRLSRELRDAMGANKAAILDLLETERLAERRIVHCGDCARYIPSAPVYRASGAEWEMPGGCAHGRTSPEARPPIYPSTGWYCGGWTSKPALDRERQ